MIWSLGVPMKQRVTLVSLCRDWPRIFERVVWLVNETFIWNYGMSVQLKCCGGFINLFLSWEQACEKEVALQHQHLKQIYLYFCSGIPKRGRSFHINVCMA